ncbi:MAG TPA: hypothetical protein VII98_03705 [Solirubrobacteraceae bacterium]
MSSRIHLSHGDELIVNQDPGDVLGALNSPAGLFASLQRDDGEQVLVNPAHVAYIEPDKTHEPMVASIQR